MNRAGAGAATGPGLLIPRKPGLILPGRVPGIIIPGRRRPLKKHAHFLHTSVTGGGGGPAPPGDPDWLSVVLLAGFDGADGATSFSDESSAAHGAFNFVNQAQLDTAQKKFGTASLMLDGVGDHVWLPDHADWHFGSGEVTIEGHIRIGVLGTNQFQELVTQWKGPSDKGWTFGPHVSTNELRLDYSTTGSNAVTIAGAFTWVADTTYHIAFDWDGSNDIRLYVDGVVVAGPTAAAVTFFNSTNKLIVGAVIDGNDNELDGWIDELRITKGVARYAGAFPPPTVAFPRQ